MSWFEDQIKKRKAYDGQQLEKSFIGAAEIVYGHKTADELLDESIITERAIDEILKWRCCTPKVRKRA